MTTIPYTYFIQGVDIFPKMKTWTSQMTRSVVQVRKSMQVYLLPGGQVSPQRIIVIITVYYRSPLEHKKKFPSSPPFKDDRIVYRVPRPGRAKSNIGTLFATLSIMFGLDNTRNLVIGKRERGIRYQDRKKKYKMTCTCTWRTCSALVGQTI